MDSERLVIYLPYNYQEKWKITNIFMNTTEIDPGDNSLYSVNHILLYKYCLPKKLRYI